ncbi:RNA-binding protein pop5 [Dimargaris xerosporica]|nr:RNA-binding protein pop5 [Dimargaris xerosporica]
MVRFKQRYLVFEIVFEDSGARLSLDTQGTSKHVPIDQVLPQPSQLEKRAIRNIIQDQMVVLFGDYGAATLQSFFQAERDFYTKVWAAMTLITRINNRPCMIRVIHAGGTIKRCQREAIRYDRDIILRWLQPRGAVLDSTGEAFMQEQVKAIHEFEN